MQNDDKTKPDSFFMDRPSAGPTMPDSVNNQRGNVVGGATSLSSSGEDENQAPIAGFLVSFSKSALGEYFPLHYGRNVIGSGDLAKIKLLEKKVSREHATILI